jgi:hypothetical protein
MLTTMNINSTIRNDILNIEQLDSKKLFALGFYPKSLRNQYEQYIEQLVNEDITIEIVEDNNNTDETDDKTDNKIIYMK